MNCIGKAAFYSDRSKPKQRNEMPADFGQIVNEAQILCRKMQIVLTWQELYPFMNLASRLKDIISSSSVHWGGGGGEA